MTLTLRKEREGRSVPTHQCMKEKLLALAIFRAREGMSIKRKRKKRWMLASHLSGFWAWLSLAGQSEPKPGNQQFAEAKVATWPALGATHRPASSSAHCILESGLPELTCGVRRPALPLLFPRPLPTPLREQLNGSGNETLI